MYIAWAGTGGFIYIHTHIHTHILDVHSMGFIYTYTHTYIHTHTHTHSDVHMHGLGQMDSFIHVYTYIYTHTHTHIHTHSDVHSMGWNRWVQSELSKQQHDVLQVYTDGCLKYGVAVRKFSVDALFVRIYMYTYV